MLLAIAFLLLGVHWQGLSSNVTDRVLSAENLILIALIYPISEYSMSSATLMQSKG